MSREEIEKYLLARLLYWRNAMLDFENGIAGQILDVLKAVKMELESGLMAAEGVSEWTRERMEALILFCDEALAGAKMASTGIIDNAFITAAEASLLNYNSMLGFSGELVNFSPVSMTAEQIRSWFAIPLGGHLLGGWVDKAFDDGVKKSVLSAIRKCGVKGSGYSKITREIIRAALDDGMNLTRREAITLARTYVQTANVQAQMAVYKANEDLLKGYRWTSILDTGVCARCGALDGLFYSKDEQRPPMPLHPRCRCLWLPVLKGDELKGEGLERAARPWLRRELKNIDAGGTRKVLAFGTTQEDFSGWWETLPERDQQFSMGPVRARLLREGKIKFSDLVDKSTGRLLTLEELGFTESGKTIPIPDKVTIESLEKMPFSRASKVVTENFRNKFPEWSKDPKENLPIAVLPESDARLIGASARVAVISPYTIKKQKNHHPELTIEDYMKAQEIIESSEKYQQTKKAIAFIENKNSGTVEIIKSTADGKEIFMISLYKLSSKDKKKDMEIKRLKKG